MVSQYDFNTGTKGVISGSSQLNPETMRIVEARMAVAVSPPNDLRANISPANTVVKPMYIIDSYPLLHGARPETYHRMASPSVCAANPRANNTNAIVVMFFKSNRGQNMRAKNINRKSMPNSPYTLLR